MAAMREQYPPEQYPRLWCKEGEAPSEPRSETPLRDLLDGYPQEQRLLDNQWLLVHEATSLTYFMTEEDGQEIRVKEALERDDLPHDIKRRAAEDFLLYRIMFLLTAPAEVVVSAMRSRCTPQGDASDLTAAEAAVVTLAYCWLAQRLLPAVERALGLADGNPHQLTVEEAFVPHRWGERAWRMLALAERGVRQHDIAGLMEPPVSPRRVGQVLEECRQHVKAQTTQALLAIIGGRGWWHTPKGVRATEWAETKVAEKLPYLLRSGRGMMG